MLKGREKQKGKGQQTKLRTADGKKKIGLCACPGLKFYSILYLIVEKSILLVQKKAFLAKLRLIKRHGS